MVIPHPETDTYALLTRPPLTGVAPDPCDLHVLSMPPAFALSQDQTLRFICVRICKRRRTNPASSRHPVVERPETYLTSVTVTHRRYETATPSRHQCLNQNRAHSQAPSTIETKCLHSQPLARKTQG